MIAANAEARADELLSSLDYLNISEQDLMIAAQKMESIYSDAHVLQERLDHDQDAR